MSSLEIMLVAGVAIPLVSFTFLALFGARLGKPKSAYVATAAIALSCILAAIVLAQWRGMDDGAREAARSQPFTWAQLGGNPVTVGVNLDSLTVIMFFMVTFVSTWIHVFSIGYMAGHSDEVDGRSKYHRFFTYLSLFCFSMLGLVIADSLLFLFIFWELVGLCSYLLIGFYFHKKSATNAGMKAFITNRVGDFGFIIGLGMVFLFLQQFSLEGAAQAFQAEYDRGGPLFTNHLLGLNYATWMGILLFCGAIGKSAQFPLHVWLPDAMEGPTPVSALIHAATMVAAGVYLVARIFVLLTPEAQMFIAVIGCITLFIGAMIAIVQTDIKKVLAYSTISQLGYMIFGMGTGAWIAALFHLLTHAFFKSLLFLGSGQVIEGCHHEQDMRNMGGLRKKMPVTCWTFFVGVIAISGVGIPWTGIGIGGFFSKDEILAVAWHRTYGEMHVDGELEHTDPAHANPAHNDSTMVAGTALGPWASADTPGQRVDDAAYAAVGNNDIHNNDVPTADGAASELTAYPAEKGTMQRLPAILFWIPIVIAYVTPFYMMRCWWLTFMGKPRDEAVHHHAHETPWMYVPLIVLAVGTLFASYLLFRTHVAEAHPADFLVASYDGHAHEPGHAYGQMVDHNTHYYLSMIVGFAYVVGFAIAWLIYRNGLATAEAIRYRLQPIHRLLEKKFYFDELYGWALVGGVHLFKNISYLFDKYIVDGIVNASAQATARISRFSGEEIDQMLVDGAVNGVGQGTWRLGGWVRAPQVGRIRNYVLFAVCGVTVLVIILVQPW